MSSVLATSILGTAYTVVTSGIGGIGLLAFYMRWIVPGGELTEVKDERDEWKAAYEKEVAAHLATREAFAAASQRGDVGVEAARMMMAVFSALRPGEAIPIHPARNDEPGSG